MDAAIDTARPRGLRAVSWWVGLPARFLILTGIRVYRAVLSGLLGGQCRFHPSCSEYADRAVRARGAVAGTALIVWRLARCNPFGRGGFDEPPAAKWARARRDRLTRERLSYDTVILPSKGAS